jgi:hypothetical protein
MYSTFPVISVSRGFDYKPNWRFDCADRETPCELLQVFTVLT